MFAPFSTGSENPPALAQPAGPMKTPVEPIRSGLKPSSSTLAFQDTRIVAAAMPLPVLSGFQFPAHNLTLTVAAGADLRWIKCGSYPGPGGKLPSRLRQVNAAGKPSPYLAA